LLCTEDDNSSYRNVCKMSVVSFALAVIFIIRNFRFICKRDSTNFVVPTAFIIGIILIQTLDSLL